MRPNATCQNQIVLPGVIRSAEGNSNKEIAGRLFLSVHTVETHRKKILEKLAVRGTADLILYAVRKGIVA